jgi:uncharacterized membrane protein
MTTFQDQRDIYLDLTDKINNFNEISNVNDYLHSMNNVELDKLNTFNSVIRSKLLKLKQEYMLNEFGIHEYTMRNNIILVSIIIAGFALVAVARYATDSTQFTSRYLMITCLILGIIYLIITLIIILRNRNRRKYDWNMYYFDPVKKQTN